MNKINNKVDKNYKMSEKGEKWLAELQEMLKDIPDEYFEEVTRIANNRT